MLHPKEKNKTINDGYKDRVVNLVLESYFTLKKTKIIIISDCIKYVYFHYSFV